MQLSVRRALSSRYTAPRSGYATPAPMHWNFDAGFSCTTLACGDDETRATEVASRRALSGNTR
jgi:hypothetical protein